MQRQLFSTLIWMAVKIEAKDDREKKPIVSDYENWRSFYLKMSYYPFCYVCHIFHFFLIFTGNLLASHRKLLLGILAESPQYSVRLCFTHSSIFSPLHSSAKVIIFNAERHPGIPLLTTLDWSLIVLRMKSTFMVRPHRSGWCGSSLFSSFIPHSPPLSCCSSYSHFRFFPILPTLSCPVEFAHTWDNLPSILFSSTV